MNRRIRRGIVVSGVVASLVAGVASIRLAADLAAASAPPPAPPISMQQLQAKLTAEQTRAAALQQQLDALRGVTGQLTAALDSTETLVTADNSTAAQLRARLKAAEARVALVTGLLRQAAARLASLGYSAPAVPPAYKPPATGGGGVAPPPKPKPAPKPTPRPQPTPPTASTSPRLSLRTGGGGVVASWTKCSTNRFYGYALVRSNPQDGIHFPPETGNTLVAMISSNSQTSVTDAAAPSGQLRYEVFCVTNEGGELKSTARSNTVSITVP